MHEKIVGTLNALIQLDYDAVQAYDRAIAKIESEMIKRDMESFRRDHERHIIDLSECVRELGGVPEELGRDFKGVLLEGLTALRSVTGTAGALKAMKTNEEITNRVYDDALGTTLPANIRRVIERNRDDERRHLAYIQRALAEPRIPKPLESNPRF
ncbi:MAG: ferritin-like domain-containing protein [Polyangiaceae bacterium]|nr:ferritin-like domain-containing protein [Polyangiaceae bacterium]